MTDNIAGKTVVITGASSGMGAAAARHLADKGAAVVLGARRADRIEALATEITDAGGKAIAMATDVTKREDLQQLVGAAVETYGRIDVIINNAGVMLLSARSHRRGNGADGRWGASTDIALKDQMFDGVGRIRRQGELTAREMVDEGVGEDVAGGVGQIADREGPHLRAGGLDEAAPPQMAQPGVGAGGAPVVVQRVRRLRVDDLLAGQDVRIGVGSKHPGAELLGGRAQRREDGGIDGIFAENAHDPTRVIVGLIDRHLAVIERVAQDFLGQVDVGLRFPGIGGRRRKRRQHGQTADAADQGAANARRSGQSH